MDRILLNCASIEIRKFRYDNVRRKLCWNSFDSTVCCPKKIFWWSIKHFDEQSISLKKKFLTTWWCYLHKIVYCSYFNSYLRDRNLIGYLWITLERKNIYYEMKRDHLVGSYTWLTGSMPGRDISTTYPVCDIKFMTHATYVMGVNGWRSTTIG